MPFPQSSRNGGRVRISPKPGGRIMLEVSETISIPLSEIRISFLQSSGPGGQNVNKVATMAQLHFDVARSTSLPSDIKARLTRLAGARMSRDGILVLEARRFRTQEQNRADALRRLSALILGATKIPKPRRVTRPSETSRAERLKTKKRHGEIKRLRRRYDGEI